MVTLLFLFICFSSFCDGTQSEYGLSLPPIEVKVISIPITFTGLDGSSHTIPVSSRVILPQEWHLFLNRMKTTQELIKDIKSRNDSLRTNFEELIQLNEKQEKFQKKFDDLNKREIDILSREMEIYKRRARSLRRQSMLKDILFTVTTYGMILR